MFEKKKQMPPVQNLIKKIHFINIDFSSITFWEIAYFVQWSPKFSDPKNFNILLLTIWNANMTKSFVLLSLTI